MIARLLQQIRLLAGSLPMTERRYARRASRGVLDIYWQVRGAHPELTGKALYTEVVATHSRTDQKAAGAIVLKAEQSFAEWPKQRDLMFRDVVAYLVFDEFMRSHPSSHGTRADMRRVAAKIIPSNL